MNLTENEIRNLPLEHKQKLVVELRGVKVGDRAYPNAKAIVDTITNQKGWKEPEKYKVKALENVLVDDRAVQKDQETEVYVWQYRALARFFELLDEKVKSGLEEAGNKARKEREKATAAQAAAALIALLLLLFGFEAKAQNQYTFKQLIGANAYTNYLGASAVSNYYAGVVTSTSITNISWSVVNGTATPATNTTTVSVTNVPGLMNLTHWDMAPIQMSFNLAGSGSSAVVAYMSASVDGVNFVTNFATLSVTANATTPVTGITNLTAPTLGSVGYLRLDAIQNLNASAITNLTFGYGVKPIRAGP